MTTGRKNHLSFLAYTAMGIMYWHLCDVCLYNVNRLECPFNCWIAQHIYSPYDKGLAAPFHLLYEFFAAIRLFKSHCKTKRECLFASLVYSIGRLLYYWSSCYLGLATVYPGRKISDLEQNPYIGFSGRFSGLPLLFFGQRFQPWVFLNGLRFLNALFFIYSSLSISVTPK